MPAIVAERPRLAVIDLIRGIAVVAMIAYHLSWDLLDYGLISVDVVNDPLWRGFAHVIAGTFLALVGFNLALANRNGIRQAPYLRRLGIIAGAAALVSLGTYWFMPQAFVYFGILHMIAVASVLALPFLRLPIAVIIVVAVLCLAAPSLLTSEAFDAKPLLWLGLSAHPVQTVDYVPVFPWFGVVLGGIAAARLMLDRGGERLLARWRFAAVAWRPILFVGRWSLPIYLLHQPLMVGIISLLMPFLAESDDALVGRFIDRCKTSCEASATSAKDCEATCGCVLTGAEGAGLLRNAMRGTMSEAEDRSWQAVVEQCLPKRAAPPVTGG
jgi:uncharacterized membrane protein